MVEGSGVGIDISNGKELVVIKLEGVYRRELVNIVEA